MSRQQREPAAQGKGTVGGPSTGVVSDAVLRQARKSGQLNLSNRALGTVPTTVWRLTVDPPQASSLSFGAEENDRWWEQTELLKLILAGNALKELSEDIQFLPALTVLDVHDNELTSLPRAIGELKALTKLMLNHNKLPSLIPEVCTLTNLQTLDLDHNQLKELPADIGTLTGLEDLNVSNNILTYLPPSIGLLSRLSVLKCTHNRLSTIPEEMGKMMSLKELDLNNNQLTSLPTLTYKCLQILDLHGNALREVPSIGATTTLKEFRLGGNKITELNGERLSPLTGLVCLELRDNKVSSIPVALTELKSLERLDITNNSVSELPFVMGLMPNLKVLSLEGNPLRGLRRDIIQRGTSAILAYLKSRLEPAAETPPHQTTKFTPTKQQPQSSHKETETKSELCIGGGGGYPPDLRKLELSKKMLSSIPSHVFQLTQLLELDLGGNKLDSLPSEMGQLTSLTLLDVRNNLLSALPSELEQCSGLRDINLSHNRFVKLPICLYKLRKLENIVAANNQIDSIDVDGLLCLPLLATLDLQNNNIALVPPKLGNVISLKHLQLGGNPFRNPRPAILSRGTPALLEYLRDRIAGPQ